MTPEIKFPNHAGETPPEAMRVHCGQCKGEWPIFGKLPMDVGKFCALVDATCKAGCPFCGATGSAIKCGTSQETNQ